MAKMKEARQRASVEWLVLYEREKARSSALDVTTTELVCSNFTSFKLRERFNRLCAKEFIGIEIETVIKKLSL